MQRLQVAGRTGQMQGYSWIGDVEEGQRIRGSMKGRAEVGGRSGGRSSVVPKYMTCTDEPVWLVDAFS